MIYLTKEHGKVISHFFDYPIGKVVCWHESKQTGLTTRSKWFYHPQDDDVDNWILDSTICEDLLAGYILKPYMSDDEYTAQVACGTKHYRSFYLPLEIKKILKKDFIDYLDRAPILWLL